MVVGDDAGEEPPLPLAARYKQMLTLLAGDDRAAVTDAHLAIRPRDPGWTCDYRANPNLRRGEWNALCRLDYCLVLASKGGDDDEGEAGEEAEAAEGGDLVVESCSVEELGSRSDHFGVECVLRMV